MFLSHDKNERSNLISVGITIVSMSLSLMKNYGFLWPFVIVFHLGDICRWWDEVTNIYFGSNLAEFNENTTKTDLKRRIF